MTSPALPTHPQPVNTPHGSRAYGARLDALLAYIGRYSNERQRPPTIREIMDALGISSTSVVAYQLAALERRGDIVIDRGITRGIRLTHPTPTTRAPARPPPNRRA